MELERTKVQVATLCGMRWAMAYIDYDAPGLVVAFRDGAYTVTHAPSGRRMVARDFAGKRAAVRCLRWLNQKAKEGGFSWDVPVDELFTVQAARTAFQEAKQRFCKEAAHGQAG